MRSACVRRHCAARCARAAFRPHSAEPHAELGLRPFSLVLAEVPVLRLRVGHHSPRRGAARGLRRRGLARARMARRSGRARTSSRSVFFGGGTPSLWSGPELGLRAVAHRARVQPRRDADLEVTVECNPVFARRATRPRRCAKRASTVCRSACRRSMTHRLRYLGRLHDAEGALTAVRARAEP